MDVPLGQIGKQLFDKNWIIQNDDFQVQIFQIYPNIPSTGFLNLSNPDGDYSIVWRKGLYVPPNVSTVSPVTLTPSGTFHGKGDRYNIGLIGSLPENPAAGQRKEQPKHKYLQINSMSTATIATCSQSCWNLRRVHRKIIHFGVQKDSPDLDEHVLVKSQEIGQILWVFLLGFPKKTKPMRPISSPKKGTSRCCSAGPS